MRAKWQPPTTSPPPIPETPEVKPPDITGGTTIDAGPPLKWLLVGLGGLALLIILVVAGGGDDDEASAVGHDAGTTRARTTRTASTSSAGPPAELVDAVADLDEALKKDRVISDVKLSPGQASVVLIESVYCNDELLRGLVEERKGELAKLGVTLVRCTSDDGTVVFEKTL